MLRAVARRPMPPLLLRQLNDGSDHMCSTLRVAKRALAAPPPSTEDIVQRLADPGRSACPVVELDLIQPDAELPPGVSRADFRISSTLLAAHLLHFAFGNRTPPVLTKMKPRVIASRWKATKRNLLVEKVKRAYTCNLEPAHLNTFAWHLLHVEAPKHVLEAALASATARGNGGRKGDALGQRDSVGQAYSAVDGAEAQPGVDARGGSRSKLHLEAGAHSEIGHGTGLDVGAAAPPKVDDLGAGAHSEARTHPEVDHGAEGHPEGNVGAGARSEDVAHPEVAPSAEAHTAAGAQPQPDHGAGAHLAAGAAGVGAADAAAPTIGLTAPVEPSVGPAATWTCSCGMSNPHAASVCARAGCRITHCSLCLGLGHPSVFCQKSARLHRGTPVGGGTVPTLPPWLRLPPFSEPLDALEWADRVFGFYYKGSSTFWIHRKRAILAADVLALLDKDGVLR